MTSNNDKMGLRYRPMAFTEQGVAILSNVLRSNRAIQVNIAIMRAFVKLRKRWRTYIGKSITEIFWIQFL